MIGWLLAAMIQVAPPLTPPPLPPEIAARIAPVAQAIATERAAQAALPPPADDAERLVRMGRLEQTARKAMIPIDLHDLPAPERAAAQTAMWAPIKAVDDANQAALLKMVPPEGWFYASRYGKPAANAAFLIVQHADEALWRRFVPVLEPLVATGEVEGQDYALMYDRLALSEGRPQRYGSQMTCKGGHWVVDRLEDPETVETRRQAMGFIWTLAEYQQKFAHYPPCQEKPS